MFTTGRRGTPVAEPIHGAATASRSRRPAVAQARAGPLVRPRGRGL